MRRRDLDIVPLGELAATDVVAHLANEIGSRQAEREGLGVNGCVSGGVKGDAEGGAKGGVTGGVKRGVQGNVDAEGG